MTKTKDFNNVSKAQEGQEVSVSKANSISCSSNVTDTNLIKAEHYARVCSRCNGLNIKQASKETGIPFSTLHDELKVWEFAGLIKLTKDFQNGRQVVLIHTLENLKKEEQRDTAPLLSDKPAEDKGCS